MLVTKNLKVLYDATEQGMKHVQEFSQTIEKNEEEKQVCVTFSKTMQRKLVLTTDFH